MSHIRLVLSNGSSTVTMNPRITQPHHLTFAFEASSMFSKLGLCFTSLLEASTWQLFLGQAFLPASPSPTFSHWLPLDVDHLELVDDSLESRYNAASYMGLSRGEWHKPHFCILSSFITPHVATTKAVDMYQNLEQG